MRGQGGVSTPSKRFVPSGLTPPVPRHNVNATVLRLLTFGGLALVDDDGPTAPRSRPPRLALLAALAAAGERGVSRERLISFFWPDSDETHGRHSLRQALYALRQELARDVVNAHGATLTLDASEITSDLAQFRDALAADDRARAVGIARGPFLDGFYLPGAPEFERWVEEERARVTAELTGALTALATDAMARGERGAAVEWWRRLTAIEPLSGRFAVGYLEALAAGGNRAEALAFARAHTARVRRELEAEPDPEVRRIEARLRAMTGREGTVAVISEPDARTPGSPAGEVTAAVPEPQARAVPDAERPVRRSFVPRRAWVPTATALLVLVATAALARERGWLGSVDATPTFAVGLVRDDGLPDSLRIGRVVTDMMATNLARVDGLSVLANSRMLELMRPGQDTTSVGHVDAARRARASVVLEGRVLPAAKGLTLEMREVELRTGIVRHAYRVSAGDRYALVDSMTRAIASRLRLHSPATSVADATTSSPLAYRLYEEGLRAYHRFNSAAAAQLMRAALEEDSTFAMAAYYESKLATELSDPTHATTARHRALRLAERAPERERLTIMAELLAEDNEPRALAVAESLAVRLPNDPRALTALAKVRTMSGDWGRATQALERAIVLDSAAGPLGPAADANCRLCQDLAQLIDVYFWSDSLAAVDRVANRFARLYPASARPYYAMAVAAARRGDSAATNAHYRSMAASGPNPPLRYVLDITLERYDLVERDAIRALASSFRDEWQTGAWNYKIALRNEGRLREATLLQRTGHFPGIPTPPIQPMFDGHNEAILAFERGEPGRAAELYAHLARSGVAGWSAGTRARWLAWYSTLRGTALAAAGDTAAVRALADSVERWGRASLYGRDRGLHHYLRGLVLAAAGRDADAVRAYRAAAFSPSLGFTRVHYALGRSLLRLGRPAEAVEALQPALRGEVDASNLYVTRTELHELLAQAFAEAGQTDSAAVHYRAVVKAWARADSAFHARRSTAQHWLARYEPSTPATRPR